MAKMDNVLDKQTKHLERIEGLAKTDRLIQLAQVALEKRLDVDENQHSLKQVQQLEGHEKVLKSIDEKLSGKGALAKKVEQLGESIRKAVPAGMTKERAEYITEKATKNPYFKTGR